MMTVLGLIGTLTVVLILIVLAVLLISAVAMLVLLGLAASMARWRTARLRLHRLLQSYSAARPAQAARPRPSEEEGPATATAPPSKPALGTAAGPDTASTPAGPDTASTPVGPDTASTPVGPDTAGSDAGPDAEPGREAKPVEAAHSSAGSGLELKLCGEGVPERRRATLSRHAPRIRRRLQLGESEKSVSGRR